MTLKELVNWASQKARFETLEEYIGYRSNNTNWLQQSASSSCGGLQTSRVCRELFDRQSAPGFRMGRSTAHHHFLKMKNTAPMIIRNPTAWFHLKPSFR
jgi:hypothetical protein